MRRKMVLLGFGLVLSLSSAFAGSASAMYPERDTEHFAAVAEIKGVVWRGEPPLICLVRRGCPEISAPIICPMKGRSSDEGECRRKRLVIDLMEDRFGLDGPTKAYVPLGMKP